MTKEKHLKALGITQWQQRIVVTTTQIKVIIIAERLDKNNKLLKAMIQSIGLVLDEIYIEPSLFMLDQQIKDLTPVLLITMGESMIQNLFKIQSSLDEMRGQLHLYGKEDISLVASYHPDDLIKNPMNKKKAFADLCFAHKILDFS